MRWTGVVIAVLLGACGRRPVELPESAPDDPPETSDTFGHTTWDDGCSAQGQSCVVWPCCGDLVCNGGICDDPYDTGADEGGDEDGCPFEGCVYDLEPDPEPCWTYDPMACGDGEKCTAWAPENYGGWKYNGCRKVQGDDQPGDPCTATDGRYNSGNDTCAKGSMCWDIDEDTGIGYCIAFCTGNANYPICTEGSLCGVTATGVLDICLLTCDPFNGGADCPKSDNLCIVDPGGHGFACVVDSSGGFGIAGSVCQYANSCNHGLICIDDSHYPGCGGTGCCTEICELGQPNTCECMDQGCECLSWWAGPDDVPIGYEHVGFCGIE